MPIYFQAVKETSATKSGIMILPCLIGMFITIMLAGPAMSLTGYYTPFMLATSILMPIGAGLLTTLKVDAKLASLIAYQALLGAACGLGFLGPEVAAQTVLSSADAPMGIAAVIFAQNFGPALFIPVAQNVFTTRLTASLGRVAPSLNATALETMGLSELKEHVGRANLEEVLLGYDHAVTQTFFLPVTLTCLTMVGSLAMEWRSVKQKQS